MEHSMGSIPREQETGTLALIIGDWFVDEHWVFGIHRSSSSSRTGQGHYRALHPIGNEVRAFCGAGRSAFFLHHVQRGDSGPLFDKVLGLGFWHRNDTNALKALFQPESQAHYPYRLRDEPGAELEVDSIDLVNLHDAYLKDRTPAYRDATEFTNRIIRIYRRGRGDRVLFERFDWEPPLRPVEWNDQRLAYLLESITDSLQGREISVILVKDLLKEAITDEIVSWLARGVGKQARWYVSSKKWKPNWLHVLRTVDLRLLLVPQVAARDAVASEDGLGCWLTRSGKPSREALNCIDTLHQVTGQQAKTRIVVLPGGYSTLCRAVGSQACDDECVVQPVAEVDAVQVPMGGASIFFPALCACMEYVRDGGGLTTKDMLRHALTCTDEWVRAEGLRVLSPISWKPDPAKWKPKPALLDITLSAEPPRGFKNAWAEAWATVDSQWTAALSVKGLGVITAAGKRQLHLWRAMIEVDGYVCCEAEKRRSLRRLVQGIATFMKHPTAHTGCILLASPGSGKTFLGRQLAEAARLRFLPFNVTQLGSRADIVGWFDKIRATQEEAPGSRLLVFIDEINTPIDGSNVYGSFLALLEEGTYVRTGQTFHLDPCVWMFAGTEDPKRQSEDERSQKGSDFVSRLSLGVVSLDADSPNESDEIEWLSALELERVYLGASLLRREYPDVRSVSELVLAAFRQLPKGTRVRDIKQLVRRFQHIQYGQVMARNVPDGWPGDQRNVHYDGWRHMVTQMGPKEKADIEIVDDRHEPPEGDEVSMYGV